MAPQDDRGRSLHVRPGVGMSASIVQKQALRFSRIFVDQPTLIVLRYGRKVLQSDGKEWSLGDGEAIVLAGGQTFDFSNRPAVHGAYEAQWLIWDPTLIQKHALPKSKKPMIKGAAPLGRPNDEFMATFDRAWSAINTMDGLSTEVARHRMAEVLVWLSMSEIHFQLREELSLATKVRRLVESAPGGQWSIASIANHFALSEATLRRHLAAEGTTLGTLVVDTRMALAMTLLQSTDAPVGNIALDLGYESASRFAVRFRQRFGFPPTAIRGHTRHGETVPNQKSLQKASPTSQYQ